MARADKALMARRVDASGTFVTLAPSLPDHSMWMSHSCSWNDMAGTFTSQETEDGGEGIYYHNS